VGVSHPPPRDNAMKYSMRLRKPTTILAALLILTVGMTVGEDQPSSLALKGVDGSSCALHKPTPDRSIPCHQMVRPSNQWQLYRATPRDGLFRIPGDELERGTRRATESPTLEPNDLASAAK
jgi:hypothetical protein